MIIYLLKPILKNKAIVILKLYGFLIIKLYITQYMITSFVIKLLA